ncbi:energy-coupling factor ABC transporter permease [Acetivibrio saccincola]|uniref:Cobalt transport protein CbiM n=1 Tax=Acetivibrio saccincola TaxID=1677857 RepID=A0A2K9EJ67_9FIRM|nr:energy-coupling factor ABC transporter permease [Acetivibrio saccincola]AUG58003.1 cobalt transport protein CbiM [Acetivibrio saccincola]HQD29385.1 energy-coupling factor ABC transporter permease [Acetivibrio saccincola]
MSHIHISDGVISAFWGLGGYLIVGLIIFLILRKVEKTDLKKKIPMTGVVAALMIVGMSVPLGPLPVHLSLAVLSAIIAGPALGFIAIFVVNFLLAFFGHGGMTIVGLNTIIIGAEAFVGSMLFRLLSKKLTPFKSASIATAIGVIVSMTMMIGLIGITTGGYEVFLHKFLDHHHEVEHSNEGVHQKHEDGHLQQQHGGEYNEEGHDVKDVKFLFFSGWTAIVIILLLGIFTESMGTGLIVKFFNKIRPDITGESNTAVTDK